MIPPTGERELALLAIQRIPFLRPTEKLVVLGLLDAGAELSGLALADLERAVGRSLPPRLWRPSSLLAEAEGDILLLERLGAGFHAIVDPRYPAALREIPQPPFGVYVRGADLPSDRPCISVVGTRHPTGLGISTALHLAADLAAAGLPVVSGLAIGVDGAAHRGALRTGGLTCAVLPCGVDSVYPSSHRSLASAILESGGLLLSEYPPGSEIFRSRFPERNRIISGLSRGLCVIEAPAGSGALITADFALEQGRDVFTAAACLGGPRSAGLDRLAAEGARPVAGAEDILSEWGIAAQSPGSDFPFSEEIGMFESAAVGRALANALRAELAFGVQAAV